MRLWFTMVCGVYWSSDKFSTGIGAVDRVIYDWMVCMFDMEIS